MYTVYIYSKLISDRFGILLCFATHMAVLHRALGEESIAEDAGPLSVIGTGIGLGILHVRTMQLQAIVIVPTGRPLLGGAPTASAGD